MDEEKLWSRVVERVKEDISRASYETWFVTTSVDSITENELVIDTGNEFQRDWLNGRYQSIVEEKLMELTDKGMSVRFVTNGEPPVGSNTSLNLSDADKEELFQRVSDVEAKMEQLENEINQLKTKRET